MLFSYFLNMRIFYFCKNVTSAASENEDVAHKKQNYTAPATSAAKCKSCKQNFEDVVYYNGHPNNSCEEFVALTHETLLLFSGEEQNLHERDCRPLHKLTGFSVYDDQGHLCAFDNDLIEANIILHLSGYIKPIYSDDPSINDGIPAHDVGPINAWYITGFDGGEKAYVGILTNYGEYMLMEPSPEYSPVVETFFQKIPLLKLIIEFLLDNGWENPTYEELLFHLQNSAHSEFDEDFLLQNAHFICKHVYSFENAAPDEEPLMTISCMKTLIKLSGVILRKNSNKIYSQKRIIGNRKVDRKATTTTLVRAVFENFFPHQMETKTEKLLKKKRCGVCDACQNPDCGKCSQCRNMLKFGGPGSTKQACKLRRCPNMELEDSEASDSNEDDEGSSQRNVDTIKKLFSYRQIVNKIEWPSDPFLIEDEKKFYDSAVVGETVVRAGDFVMLNPDALNKPLIIAKIISLFSKHSQPTVHAQMYCRGINTILGETADPQELFVVEVCEDCPLGSIVRRAQVAFKKTPENWSELGGIQTLATPSDNEYTFFYSKKFDTETGRFTDYVEELTESESHGSCCCCRMRSERKRFESKILEENSVKWRGESYRIGSSVFLNPTAYKFNSSCPKSAESNIQLDIDEERYPEYYRKMADVRDGSENISQPFCIGQIEDILNNKSDKIKIKVRIFYRPENTKKSIFLAHEQDLNLVYWTDEVITTSFDNVLGKCFLTYCVDVAEASEWSEKGPYRFYFTEAYNPKTCKYSEIPKLAAKVGYFGKGNGKAAKSDKLQAEIPPEWDKIPRPLRCMDVFAGCGGLSLGLHQAGVAETRWAIENMDKPAQAFKINNNNNCKVFTDDCNKLLKRILSDADGVAELPVKGEVELLVGGPPCQGFCSMNRFSERQYSLLKNSLVATFLSYCDYYRPKYFLLENVRNFGSFKRSLVLKLTLRCLLAMNYQVAFGVLQAGHYGVPQARRRFILIAAAPGCLLPNFPEPQNVFYKRDYQLSLSVDGIRYCKGNLWVESAPYRTICIRDAISDLPNICTGNKDEKMLYDGEAVSHFQRKMRENSTSDILFDHVCKEMAAIVEARISYIPLVPGSDWRDLPNICVKLKDNTTTSKLQYYYCSKKQNKFDRPRAICTCGMGKKCDPIDRQLNTLIPWCLPHTADRHNNWAGLYGRLEWDEVFKTTTTNPEPMGKQGKVIHPEQNRVVSVRECARSQGFPDHFRFFGSIMDKHRQVGNAVPPPLGKAVGLEIKKAIAQMN